MKRAQKFNADCEDCLRNMKHDRFWCGGRTVFMAFSSGYIMARKPRCMPVVIPVNEWMQLPFVGHQAKALA